MKTTVRLGATIVATVAVATAIVGCSSGPRESSGAATTVTDTTSAAPAASQPLSDFAEDPDGPQFLYYSFGTPTGQIQCRVVGGGLACQTEGRSYTVADDALCGFYPGDEQGNARRFGYFDERKQPCATIIQGEGFDSPHTLAYGRSVSAELSSGLTVTCTSAVEGLTCTQAGATGARGFFLSVDSFTVL